MTFDNLRGIATPEDQQQVLEYASSPQKQTDAERFKQRIAVLAEQIKTKTEAKRYEKERAERVKTLKQLCDAYIVSALITWTLFCLTALASGEPLVGSKHIWCLPLALALTPTITRLMSRKD